MHALFVHGMGRSLLSGWPLSEVSAPWIRDQVLVHELHTLLPASARVARIVLDRLDVAG